MVRYCFLSRTKYLILVLINYKYKINLENVKPVISGQLGIPIDYTNSPFGLITSIIPSSLRFPNSNLATYSKLLGDTTQDSGPNLPSNYLNTLK